MNDRSPATFVVGAGAVAIALSGGLRLAGVPVLGLWARRADAARQAGATAGIAAFSSAPPDIMMESDVIILAVRDNAISEVAAMLIGTGLVNRRHVLLHCAGAMPAEVAFAAVTGKVAGVGVLHPLRAITDGKRVMHELKGTVFGIQGDAFAVHQAESLVAAVGGTVLPLVHDQMAAYHAAAALASNLIVALVDTAVATLTASGMSEKAATDAVIPLALSAVQNLSAHGIVDGLTGAVKRGDADTVTRHLAALQRVPGAQEIYRILSSRALAIATRAGLQPDAGEAVANALATPTST
jgi:predicted short-subunit dehydrogenase-like oxidoreductase (DUF2520 family)